MWTSKPPASLNGSANSEHRTVWRRVFGKALQWYEKPCGQREWGPGYGRSAVAFNYQGYQPGIPDKILKVPVALPSWAGGDPLRAWLGPEA